jgi:hypothetical protein
MTKYLKPRRQAAKYLGVNVRIRRVGGNKAMIAPPQNPQIDSVDTTLEIVS